MCELREMYNRIEAANPMVPVVALAIVRRRNNTDHAGAEKRRRDFIDGNGADMGAALDFCVVYLTLHVLK